MKALRWHGRRDVRLEATEDSPPPAECEIRIRVEWCGICGTDVEEYTNGPIVIPTAPHPLTGFQAPMIIGHEVCGRIIDVGKSVDHLSIGQLVGIDGSLFCGQCTACRRHQVNLCEKWAFIGMSYPGGLAEKMTIPAYMATAVSGDVPAEWVALAEPFSVAVRAVRRSELRAGERAAVLGGGTIGLAVLQIALLKGASEVTVVDPTEFRRNKALELGAQRVFDFSDRLVDLLRQDSSDGPDVIFDCTGDHRTPGMAVHAVRPGGRVIQVGLPPSPGEMDFLQVALREVSVIGCVGHVFDEDYASAVHLIASGNVDAGALITHRLALSEAVTGGLEMLSNPKEKHALKVVIAPCHA